MRVYSLSVARKTFLLLFSSGQCNQKVPSALLEITVSAPSFSKPYIITAGNSTKRRYGRGNCLGITAFDMSSLSSSLVRISLVLALASGSFPVNSYLAFAVSSVI